MPFEILVEPAAATCPVSTEVVGTAAKRAWETKQEWSVETTSWRSLRSVVDIGEATVRSNALEPPASLRASRLASLARQLRHTPRLFSSSGTRPLCIRGRD